MVVRVDTETHRGNNDGMKTTRNPMQMSPQERHPHLTTSISGIDADEWKALHAMAQQEGVTNREALERDNTLSFRSAHEAGGADEGALVVASADDLALVVARVAARVLAIARHTRPIHVTGLPALATVA